MWWTLQNVLWYMLTIDHTGMADHLRRLYYKVTMKATHTVFLHMYESTRKLRQSCTASALHLDIHVISQARYPPIFLPIYKYSYLVINKECNMITITAITLALGYITGKLKFCP